MSKTNKRKENRERTGRSKAEKSKKGAKTKVLNKNVQNFDKNISFWNQAILLTDFNALKESLDLVTTAAKATASKAI